MIPDPLPRTAVVTVTYNSEKILDAFLKSIEESESQPPTVVIADNRSEDLASVRAISSAHGARLLELDRNLGYGGAVNAAVRVLDPSFEYVLISNPDLIVHRGAISRLVERMDQDPRAAAVGPRVLNPDGTTYPSARLVPSLRTGIGHALLTRVWPTNPWTRAYRAEQDHPDRVRSAGWLSGACVLVRRSVFEELGGFDEGYFMYFEDVDLGYRFGRGGWRNIYEPAAEVTHAGAHSTSTQSARMLAAHHASAYRFLARKYRGWYLAPLRWTLRIALDVRFRLSRH
ncbi:glycosyltransferase family 2 protein [Agromyces sp. SYSU T00266]|uniref:glycosyltransferase family 2 protein n=1 Tax=Agromyces zhanjiangensis TaxID=3158562 RepID=UPI0033987CA5